MAGPAGSATDGGRGRQRSRCSSATGRGAGHSVVGQRGRIERELTATVFKTYLVPCSEPVAEAMAEPGRFYYEAAGAANKDRPEAERAEAHEELGPPFVHVWVAFLRSLAATKGLAPEHVATVKTYWEGNVVKSSLPGEAVQEDRGQGRVDAHRVLPRSGYSPTRASTGSSAAVSEGRQEARLGPARTPRERSIEARKLSAWPADWSRSVSVWLTSCAEGFWIRRWRMLSS